jgi:plastocyanin
MIRGIIAAGIAAAAALLVATAATGRASAPPTLHGSVGPGFTIKLTKGGTAVKRLRPGTYRLVVADRSTVHNFVLEKERSGAERQLTSVSFTGTRAVTIKLTAGVWKFYCDPHAAAMFGRFRVGAGAAPAATTTTDDHGGHGEDEPGDDHGGR